MLTFLAASVLAAQGVTDFDGLRLNTEMKPTKNPASTTVQMWSGQLNEYNAQIQKDRPKGSFMVRITDVSQAAQKPTEDQVLAVHDRNQRMNQAFVGHNFRRSEAKIGSSKLLVLNGSVVTVQQPTPLYVLSFAFLRDGKAYEFVYGSRYQEDVEKQLGSVVAMKFAGKGGDEEVTGLANSLKGDYTIAGLPFIVSGPKVPFPITYEAPDGTFGGSYTALVDGSPGVRLKYHLREVKESDKRSDSELLKAIAEAHIGKGKFPEGISVQKGSFKGEFLVDQGLAWKGHIFLQMERSGKWVAVLAGVATGKQKPNWDEVKLRKHLPKVQGSQEPAS